jgi:hypothetical protein
VVSPQVSPGKKECRIFLPSARLPLCHLPY